MDERKPGQGAGKSAGKPSFLDMELFLLGELEAAEARSLAEKLDRDPVLAAQLEAMKKERLGIPLVDMRRRLASASARGGSGSPEGRSAWNGLREGLSRVFARRVELAFGILLCLAAVGYFSLRSASQPRWALKGKEGAEVMLANRSLEYHDGDRVPARNGDTVFFLYRSPVPVFSQIWHREDGGPAKALTLSQGATLAWPASLSWQKAKQNIVLEGDWLRQEILVLCAPEAFGSEAASAALAKPAAGGPIAVFTFGIVRKDVSR